MTAGEEPPVLRQCEPDAPPARPARRRRRVCGGRLAGWPVAAPGNLLTGGTRSVAKVDSAVLESLRTGFSGQLLEEDSPGYEDARRVHNGMIDRRPGLIARCEGAADIIDAVRFGVANGLEISVRGGGHNVAASAVCEGGLMIDLAPMKGVSVEPARRTAGAPPGGTWGRFTREPQSHGMTPTGGVLSSPGVAGRTLGGGITSLMGKYRLVVDNLLG